MRRILSLFLCINFFLISIAVFSLRMILGAPGKPFADLSTPSLYNENLLETVAEIPEPPGNIAVSADHRIFFNFHTEARPEKIKVAELVQQVVTPFPSEEAQNQIFDTVFSVRIDRQNRLWTLDHGMNGLRQPRLLAFDLQTQEIVHDHHFSAEIAGLGSFLNDLQIDSKGEKIYIADTSVFARKPAIIVYNTMTKKAQRFLQNHPSVQAEDLLIQTNQKHMVFLGGFLGFKPALDSIVLDKNDQWLYYGAMAGSVLYRIAVSQLNSSLSSNEIQNSVEIFGRKPQSDGLTIDQAGTIYITAIELGSIMTLDQSKNLKTLIKTKKIRWPDGFSFGPEGWLYLTDSALTDSMLMSKNHIRSSAPYFIYRLKLPSNEIPGH